MSDIAEDPSRTGETADHVLAFAHIGDLHITDARQQNFRDFLSIVAQIEVACGKQIDFVALPGDNADNGRPDQYALVATGLKMLSAPVHIIAGDHDMEQGGLEAFYAGLGADTLPKAVSVRGVRCLFLDINGPGGGGPDFRLGARQLAWLERELSQARERGQTSVVFMHSYPADLKGDGEAEALTRLIGSHDVALVDIGHTHYNELANDGRAIYAATRSTGQIEEGPVGYSIATLDDGVVGWRFKPLDEPFPFVVITAPADHRLLRDRGRAPSGAAEVRALVWGGRTIVRCECQVDEGAWIAMARAPGQRLWKATAPMPVDAPLASLTVQAFDETGRPGRHTIRVATAAYVAPARTPRGDDSASIGAWPENGVFATQLGPNRNGKPSS